MASLFLLDDSNTDAVTSFTFPLNLESESTYVPYSVPGLPFKPDPPQTLLCRNYGDITEQ